MSNRKMSIGLKCLLERARYDKIAAYNAAILMEQEHRGSSAIQHFYTRSASMGYAPAMLMLAALYMKGDYLQQKDYDTQPQRIKDIDAAFQWIKLAAKQDDPTALYMLARCYLEGVGVDRNPTYCRYYLSQIPFPDSELNPYEISEAVVFGNVSSEVKDYVRRRRKARTLTTAG